MKTKLSIYKNIFLLAGFLTASLGFSQTPIPATVPSSSENYIFVIEPELHNVVADEYSPGTHTIQYFDGLGRPKQTVQSKANPNGNDMIIHYEYDGFGRQVKDHLPVRVNQNNGAYVTDPISKYNVIYANQFGTDVYYSQKEIENSPLGRVMKQAAPGDEWELGSGKEIKFQYQANTTTDQVKRYTAATGWSSAGPTLSGNYANGLLYKTITTDENGNDIQEFKNKQGQVILKRTYVTPATTALGRGTDPGNPIPAPVKADTYYIYDIYGNLTYVIPPLASFKTSLTTALRNDLCYQYKYDDKNRLIEKKLPGKEWEFMVYDKQDRLVATQDANLRVSGQWLFTKYDKFGRVLITGLVGKALSRQQLQLEVNGWGDNNTLGNSSYTNSGITIYYQQTSGFPGNASHETFSVNYYDNYANIGASPKSNLQMPSGIRNGGTTSETSNNGMLTASFTKILTTDQWEKSLIYYDVKSRPVLTLKTNYLGGYTESLSTLNFRGQPKQVETFHKRANKAIEVKTIEKFDYDMQGRLLRHTHKIGSKQEEVLALNTYDQFGKLSAKKVGGTNLSGTNRLQEVNYQYNIRGWLTDINNVDSDLTAGRGIPDPMASDDLFAFRINYNMLSYQEGLISNIPAAALYNGNISQTFWKSSTDNKIRGYAYEYDQLNRLRYASYTKVNVGMSSFPGAYDEALAYDLNGNILNLVRYTGDANENQIGMDELYYTYQNGNNNSNRLLKVTDAVSGSSTGGFSNGTSANANDYTYDPNGNMLSDLNKGITDIIYNHLNLPEQITFSKNNTFSYIYYLYNAAGQKVMKTVADYTDGTGIIKEVDYLDGFQYAGEVLQFFPTSEGYVSATPGQSNVSGTFTSYVFNYVYNYTDHLGNIRLSYTKDPVSNELKIMEENHYYPFGLKHAVYSGSNIQQYQLVDNMPGNEPIARPTYVTKTDYQYKFNGKELQDELGLNLYDFEARGYDPATVRTTTMDPLADNFATMSPYSFFNNNPLIFVDPTGMAAEHIYKLNEKTGDIDLVKKTADNHDTIVAENGDVIADNIDKRILNEAKSVNIQENGLRIENADAGVSMSLANTMMSLSVYTQKEIAWGDYAFNDANGNPTGSYFIDVMPYAESTHNSVGVMPEAMEGTTFMNMYHTHPSFVQIGDVEPVSGRIAGSNGGTNNPSFADREITKRSGITGNHLILGRTGNTMLNSSGKTVNSTQYSKPIYTKQGAINARTPWKKRF